jgi:4-amino-4-deoxy-L-arabinose transferase-like glycosyltransferase
VNSIPEGRAGAGVRGFASSRAAAVALVVLSAAVLCATSVRFLSHSELRYVQAGSEMAAGGDWVVPHLSYVPYFEKPILTYWLEAASQTAFGTGDLALHLPSILACVAMVWTAYAFGRHLRGAAFGLGAAALLLSSVIFQEMGTAVLTDAPFAALVAFAFYAFRRHDRAPESGWIWAFWTALGFAFLTKGPLCLALTGTSIFAYLVLSWRLRDCLSMRLVRGALVIVAINLPWTVLVWRRDPRFLEFFYVRENLQAFVDEKVNHPGAFYFYVPWLAAALCPFLVVGLWAVCVGVWDGFAPVVRRVRGTGAAPDDGRLYLACTVVLPFLFLSASASKLATYLLPVFPSIALLAASYVADHLAKPTPVLRRGTAIQAWTLAAAVAALVIAVTFFPEKVAKAAEILNARPLGIASAIAALLVPMLAGGIVMARGRVVAGMTIVGAGALACVLAANALAPDFASETDTTEVVVRMCAVRRAGERVVVSGPCSDDYAIVRTLGERPYIWGKTAELGMGHFTQVTPQTERVPDDVYRIGDDDHPLPRNPWLLDTARFRAEWAGAARMWFVGRTKDVVWLRANGFTMQSFAERDDMTVVTNRPVP